MADYLTGLLLALCLGLAGSIGAQGEIVNEQVTRKIDITTQVAKYSTKIVLKNAGSSSQSDFVYAVEPQLSQNLAFISAKVADRSVKVLERSGQDNDDRAFTVSLPSPLGAGASVTVDVETTFTHSISAFPENIGQNDKQLVRFTANVYFHSPYPTVAQSSTFQLPTATPESFTRVKPVVSQDSTVVYGPFPELPAHSAKAVTLHFENSSPFLTVSSLDRLVEVSHWGNVAVEERMEVQHSGALLRGSFSRYDLQRNPASGAAAVKSYKTLLPAAARDVYYRDEIGNISTSHLREDADAVEVELRPRYPLFGGWRTKYTLGYNLPSYEYLFHAGKQFSLRMRVLDHIFDEQVVDRLSLRIVLPEGAKNIQFEAPYKMEQQPQQHLYTYLDTTGRPVVVVTASNLIDQHIDEFTLSYQFDSTLLLLEPLLVTAAIYLFFLTVIVLVRLDFTISEDESAVAKQRMSVTLETVASTVEDMLGMVAKVEGTIETAKQNRNAQTVTAALKAVVEKWKASQTKISSTLETIAQDSPDTAAKVKELGTRLSGLLGNLQKAGVLAVSVIEGPMNVQLYDRDDKVLGGERKKMVASITETIRDF